MDHYPDFLDRSLPFHFGGDHTIVVEKFHPIYRQRAFIFWPDIERSCKGPPAIYVESLAVACYIVPVWNWISLHRVSSLDRKGSTALRGRRRQLLPVYSVTVQSLSHRTGCTGVFDPSRG